MPKPIHDWDEMPYSDSDDLFTKWDTDESQDMRVPKWDTQESQEMRVPKWDTEESQEMRFPPIPGRFLVFDAADPFVSTPTDPFDTPRARHLGELVFMPIRTRGAIHPLPGIPVRKDPKPFHVMTEEVEKEDRDTLGRTIPLLSRGEGDDSWQRSSAQKDEDLGIDRSLFDGLIPDLPWKKLRDVTGRMLGKAMASVFSAGPQHRGGIGGHGSKSLPPGGPPIVARAASDRGSFARAVHPTSPSSKSSSSWDRRACWSGGSNQQTQHQLAMPVQNEGSATSPLRIDVGDHPHNVRESGVSSNRLVAHFTRFRRS